MEPEDYLIWLHLKFEKSFQDVINPCVFAGLCHHYAHTIAPEHAGPETLSEQS